MNTVFVVLRWDGSVLHFCVCAETEEAARRYVDTAAEGLSIVIDDYAIQCVQVLK